MRRSVLRWLPFSLGPLSALMALGGLADCAVYDPTCTDQCEGAVAVYCSRETCGGNPCDRKTITRRDCALEAGPSGNAMTCRYQPPADNTPNGDPVPTCIDVTLPSCPQRWELVCTGLHTVSECVVTTEGGFLYPRAETSCKEGKECHPFQLVSVICVDSPMMSCDPAQHPRCIDDVTIQLCDETADAGYATSTGRCAIPPGSHCVGDPGHAECR